MGSGEWEEMGKLFFLHDLFVKFVGGKFRGLGLKL